MIAETILTYLIYDNDYCRKVFPYLKDEYFENNAHKKIFNSISKYVNEYREPPTPQALKVLLTNRIDLSEQDFKDIKDTLMNMEFDKNTNKDWMMAETEKYCQEMAFHNALKKCIQLTEKNKNGVDKGAAPQIMAEALSVNFDSHIRT